MKSDKLTLDALFLEIFREPECEIFLAHALDDGRDIWNSTDGAWNTRAFQAADTLRRRGRVDRRLFEALIREVPGRADIIAAVCRYETGQPLNYTTAEVPPAREFPWADYQQAMSASLIRLLRSAAYDARSRGYDTISTSEVFRIYRTEQPWVAAAFPNAELKRSKHQGEEDPFDKSLGASYCVSKTIHGLAQHTEQGKKFDEHDVFLDLARFGDGNSARRLSPNGESLERLNQLSRELKVGRTTRHGVLD